MSPHRITAATLAAMLALGAATVTPAAAASPPSAGTTGPKTATVTLITGDVVDVTDAGAGKKAATVRPAPGREGVSFHTIEADGGLRVLPSDAVPYVSAGVLDVDLFDVDELIADGYGDSAAQQLPLIVKDSPGFRGSQDLAGTTTTRQLPSIGGRAVDAAKDQLPELWKSLKPAAGARALNSGVGTIWLDGKVRPVLDKSVPQIGAPDAWQAGYEGSGVEVAVLDTGVDATHPDLAGKVKESQDFSGSPSGTEDHFGHGTHVAATIAGTGAGAGGTRKGVAPKADLLVGKVLGDDGYGYDSWIIAGMEWAAAEGAKVVSMSLGGPADRRHRPAQPGGQRHHRTDRHAVRRRGRQRGPGRDGRYAGRRGVGVDGRSRGPGRWSGRLLQPWTSARRCRSQAGDHRSGCGHRRRPGGRNDHGRSCGQPLHGRLRYVDGHAARGRSRSAARPAAPGLEGRPAEERLGQHGEDPAEPDRLRPGRRPGRPDPGDRTEGLRHRRRRLRTADNGGHVEPLDHLSQPGSPIQSR